VTDLENEVVVVICPEVDAPTGICRLKTNELRDGLLGDLLRRGDENPMENPAPRCTLA
jgi:hypothetical protein